MPLQLHHQMADLSPLSADFCGGEKYDKNFSQSPQNSRMSEKSKVIINEESHKSWIYLEDEESLSDLTQKPCERVECGLSLSQTIQRTLEGDKFKMSSRQMSQNSRMIEKSKVIINQESQNSWIYLEDEVSLSGLTQKACESVECELGLSQKTQRTLDKSEMDPTQMSQNSSLDSQCDMNLTQLSQMSCVDGEFGQSFLRKEICDEVAQLTQKSRERVECDLSLSQTNQRTLEDEKFNMSLSQMSQNSWLDSQSDMNLTQLSQMSCEYDEYEESFPKKRTCGEVSQLTQKSCEDVEFQLSLSQTTQKTGDYKSNMTLSQMSQNSWLDSQSDMNLTQLSQMSCACDEYVESFLQKGTCREVAPKLPRCQSCTLARYKIYSECRFDSFRKLRYSRKGHLVRVGFLDAYRDVEEDDLKLWLASPENTPPHLSREMAKYIFVNIGEEFCKLVKDEKHAVSVYESLALKDKRVAWKKLLPNVREMCDVCYTTLFNVHYTCRRCGFAVCIDCYQTLKDDKNAAKTWTQCVCKRIHRLDLLILTQIIPRDTLNDLNILAIETRSVASHCGCPANPISPTYDHASQKVNVSVTITSIIDKRCEDYESDPEEECFNLKQIKNWNLVLSRFQSELSLSEVMDQNGIQKKRTSDNLYEEPESPESKRIKIYEENIRIAPNSLEAKNDSSVTFNCNILSDSSVTCQIDSSNQLHNCLLENKELPYIQTKTLLHSVALYPDLPHSWLCQGRLLRLLDPHHPSNLKIFQDYWIKGQPILVSNVHRHLNKDIWKPEAFLRDFGDMKNDLVNCLTGMIIPDQYMRTFWKGFQSVSKMLKDVKGNPMLLKLKDWPPEEDFAKLLPLRFKDLMRALPLGEYTRLTGELNLTARLPDSFVKPDLGPKLYIAYGSAIHPTKGTTNLHIDMSDAVNIMVYAGIPQDVDFGRYVQEIYRAVDQACSLDEVMKNRYHGKSEIPGALWHIYDITDSDKIRDLLNKVAIEQGMELQPHRDPIHDQIWYLDEELRERLYIDYGVKGYTIIQSLGDAVFIPAGAPHQVKNLVNCIKVAEDFVSPENVSHCIRITQEFRKLSHFHTNHEDKLQIKNIIYHAMKDCLSLLRQEETQSL